MVKVRAKSKQLAQVLCQTAEVLKAGSLSDYSIRVPVSMYHHGFQKEDVTLVISAPTELSPGGWRLDSSQIESILGLWLWSLVSDGFTSAAGGRQYSPLPGGISSARIVGAEVVETLVSERDSNLQAQFSLWMGKNVVTIESCMFIFDPLANLACADVWSEDTIKTAGSEVPWMKLAQPEAVRKGKRFFGWVSLQELYETQDSSQLVTHPEIEGSGPVETNAEVTSLQNPLKIRLHYVNPIPGSDDSAADTLLSECTRELYTIILTQMVSSVTLGDILTKQRFGQLILENETVTALEKKFADPDNNLGDGKDALLCILPAFQSQLNSVYGSDLIPSLIEAATDSRRRGQLRSAEKFLLFACSLGEKSLDSKDDKSSHKATSEAAFIALGELFRWALSEPSNPDTRKFAYAGTRRLAKMITDKTPRESNRSAFKRSIFARYAALAMKTARENGEELNLALNLDSYNALSQPELEKLDTVSPRPENKRLGAKSEIDDQTLSEIVRPLLVSIENKERTKTLYLLSRLTKKTVEAAKAFMEQAIPLAASCSWSEVVDALLELGLMIDSEDNTRKTALLHFASIGDHIQATRMLQKGARPYHEDQSKNSALLYAARNGHEAVVRLLLRTKDVHASGNAGADLTPLMAAAFEGHLGTVRLLLADNRVDSRMQGRDGFTPFFVAVLNGKVHVVDWYLHEHNISVDDHSLKHSLIAAAWLGHAQVMESLLSESQIDPNLMLPGFPMSVILDFLAKVGTRIDAPPDGGCRTPLSLAAAGGHLKCVRVLLAHDSINVNGIASESFTPLFLAPAHNHHETSRSISDKKSDSLNQKPEESFKRLVDKTPIEIALLLGWSQILLLLLEQPNIRIPTPARRFGARSWTDYDILFGLATQEGVQIILQALMSSHYPIHAEAKNISLYIAVENGHPDIVNFLLNSCQCDPNASNYPLNTGYRMNMTPFYAAAVTPGKTSILRIFLNHPHTDVNFVYDERSAIWYIVETFDKLRSHFYMLLNDSRIDLTWTRKSEKYYALSTVHFSRSFGDKEWGTLLKHPKLDWNFLQHDNDNILCRLAEKGFGASVRIILSHQGTRFNGPAPSEPWNRNKLLLEATMGGHVELARALLDDGRYVSPDICERLLSVSSDGYYDLDKDIAKAVLEWLYAACENLDIASEHVKKAVRVWGLPLETKMPLETVVDALDLIIYADDIRRKEREEEEAAKAEELAEIPIH